MKRLFSTSLVLTICLVYGLPKSLSAVGSSGLSNITGTTSKAGGHGYAFTGVADDPSAIFFNPAGIAHLKGWQMMTGLTVITLDSEHTDPTGKKDKMETDYHPVPYFYLTRSKEQSPWAFGIGVNSPYGLSTEWKSDSFSRNYATESVLKMFMINPTISYSLSDQISLGGGLDYMNIFDAELNSFVLAPNGKRKISGDGDGWGYNAGVLYKPHEKHSFGASYRSQINVPVEGEAELTNIGFLGGADSFKTNMETEFKLPQNVTLGYGFKPNERWTIFADYEWVEWSSTQETAISYNQPSGLLPTALPRNWKNTNNVGVGAELKLTQTVDLRFGGMAYESAIPSKTREASLPGASRGVLTLGSGLHFGTLSIDIAYNAIFYNEYTIDNNQELAGFYSQDGKYETFGQSLSVGVRKKWGGVN